MEAMGCFAAFAITLFLVALVPITVINGGVQMVIYFPIYKIIFPEGKQKKKLNRPQKGLEQVGTMQHSFVRMGQNPF